MPYAGERGSSLSATSSLTDAIVAEALGEYEVSHAFSIDTSEIAPLTVDVATLPASTVATDVAQCISIDGSRQETLLAQDGINRISACYARVGSVTIDLPALRALEKADHIDPVEERATRHETALNYVLPGNGLSLEGMGPADSWRAATDRMLARCAFTDTVLGGDGSHQVTLADALLMLHGSPGRPANSITVRRCPDCTSLLDGVKVGRDGGACDQCGAILYLVDALGLDEVFFDNGRENALNAVMSVSERLCLVATIELMRSVNPARLARTLVVADGPLAAIGAIERLTGPMLNYLDAVAEELADSGYDPMLVVGVEKGGNFATHGHQVADAIPRGHAMMLTTDYIARNITGRPGGRDYGVRQMYGRRFFYRRKRDGAVLTLTVPARAGLTPYGQAHGVNETWDAYPTLRTVIEVLEGLTDARLHGAVLPLTYAHQVASITLNAATVLRINGQQRLGIARNTRLGPIAPPTW